MGSGVNANREEEALTWLWPQLPTKVGTQGVTDLQGPRGPPPPSPPSPFPLGGRGWKPQCGPLGRPGPAPPPAPPPPPSGGPARGLGPPRSTYPAGRAPGAGPSVIAEGGRRARGRQPRQVLPPGPRAGAVRPSPERGARRGRAGGGEGGEARRAAVCPPRAVGPGRHHRPPQRTTDAGSAAGADGRLPGAGEGAPIPIPALTVRTGSPSPACPCRRTLCAPAPGGGGLFAFLTEPQQSGPRKFCLNLRSTLHPTLPSPRRPPLGAPDLSPSPSLHW